MDTFDNKNKLQKYFNQQRGIINEINDAEKYCSITLTCGHERTRPANFAVKKAFFIEKIKDKFKIGEKVSIRFYVTSHKNNNKWHTNCHLIDIQYDKFKQPD